jgi:UDP-N-acetylmuramoyl-tripeptide--D-alanyl-D-alanine ligase
LLERQVKQLQRKNDIKIIAVAGSVGKTSTKFAIAKTLGASKKVIFQEGNYNDRITVPLVLFGHVEPGIYNIFAWLKILNENRKQLKRPYPYEIAVLEIGTDAPGQMKQFAYLKPELSIITAVAVEHIEYFKTLDAIAAEELAPIDYSKATLINRDDVPAKYLDLLEYKSYGHKDADYEIIKTEHHGLYGQTLTFKLADNKQFEAGIALLGEQGAKMALAAVAVGHIFGLSINEIKAGLATLEPVSGRMQILKGKKDSTLIDDTYNASPIAAIAALDVLQGTDAPQRIAILGSMNELGDESPHAHRELGFHCDSDKLDLVITIGSQAADYLAPAAAEKGCKVESFNNPFEAGKYVAEHVKHGAVVLVKGSQNGVFAEEALKQLLADKADEAKLVRQSDYWLKRKAAQFS